ncbi:MAG: hypothetical protein AABY95_05900 [Pseudomonadota bacterium]
MELDEQDRKFSQAAKQALRQSERALDATTTARLRAAREQALAAAAKPRLNWNWMMPTGAVAAALMVFALLPGRAPLGESAAVPRDEAMEVMLDDVEPELVQDLELYVWLEFDGDPA